MKRRMRLVPLQKINLKPNTVRLAGLGVGIFSGLLMAWLIFDSIIFLALASLMAGGVLAYLAGRYPVAAVIILIAYFPFEESIIALLPIPDGVASVLRYGAELLIYWLFVVVVIDRVRKGNMKGSLLDVPLIMLVATVLVSAVVNITGLLDTVLFIRVLIRYAFLFLVIINLDIDRTITRKIIHLIIGIGAIQIVIGMAQKIIGDPLNNLLTPISSTLAVGGHQKEFNLVEGTREIGAIFGTAGDTVSLAVFLIVAMCLSAAYAYYCAERWRPAFAGLSLIFLAGILFTYTRGALPAGENGMFLVVRQNGREIREKIIVKIETH